eukprot:gene30070-13530_t
MHRARLQGFDDLTAALYVAQLAEALPPVLHRDIKPECTSPDLGDFGRECPLGPA